MIFLQFGKHSGCAAGYEGTMNTQVIVKERLRFRAIGPEDFGEIAHRMELTDSRTCDYTLGGIVLWTKYFNYRMALADDTLYISGGREDNLSVRAFALPLGGTEFTEEIEQLMDYAGGEVWFSAIPEDRLHLFAGLDHEVTVEELGPEWSDYLYDIQTFAHLTGGAMKKKRNHVNRYMADHPDAHLVPLTEEWLPGCLELLARCGHDRTPTGTAEYDAVEEMLLRWGDYEPWFTGRVLVAGGEVAGFTVGETKGDTLHVHVERADHTQSGSNETLASEYAREMLARNPRLRYVNRQDDAGDPGLRAGKESWHPLRLLPKFNVYIG